MFAVSDLVLTALITAIQTVAVSAIGVIVARQKHQTNRIEDRQVEIRDSVNGRLSQLMEATTKAAKVDAREEVIQELHKLPPNEGEQTPVP